MSKEYNNEFEISEQQIDAIINENIVPMKKYQFRQEQTNYFTLRRLRYSTKVMRLLYLSHATIIICLFYFLMEPNLYIYH